MTPADIYGLTPISTSNNVRRLWSKDSPDVFPNAPAPLADSVRSSSLQVKTIVAICTDGCRRTWELYTIWWEGDPFAIVSLGGREGEDIVETIITNDYRYEEFLQFLLTSVLAKSEVPYYFLDTDVEIPGNLVHSGFSLTEACEHQQKFAVSRINPENIGLFSESIKTRFT